ncbi:hypothetical protein D3C87_2041120 [compost metagenome]
MHHFQEMAAAGLTGIQIAVVYRGITEQRLGNRPGLLVSADHIAGAIASPFHPARGAGVQKVYP